MGLAPICYLFDLTIDLHIIICPFNEFILKLQANLIHDMLFLTAAPLYKRLFNFKILVPDLYVKTVW